VSARWRDPPHGPGPPELDVWDVLAAASSGRPTLHLLSKEGAGTAAPVVTALVDRVLEVAELIAQASGGGLDPPLVAVLDEAANICPIRSLPQLYSHYGSRGIQVLTMLQSYQQGAGVWGEQGMHALWSAATVKIVGAGVDDHAFLQRLSGLIGEHYVERISTSVDRTRVSRQYAHAREPVLSAADLRALPRDQALLLTTARAPGSAGCIPGTANATRSTSAPTPDPRSPSCAATQRSRSAPTTPSTAQGRSSMDTPADDTDRVLTVMRARIETLEAWRSHQSDLLDELLNGMPAIDDSAADRSKTSEADEEIDLDGLIIWMHATITSVIARPLRGDLIWCPLWFEHPEAVMRLEALRRAWIELAPEPGASMSIWIRDHLDPCLRELMSPLGTFADCHHSSRQRGTGTHTPLPTLPRSYRTDSTIT
jgi:hypothetical protein